MRKKLLFIGLAIGIVIGLHFSVDAQSNPNFWLLNSSNLKPISNGWGLQVVSTPCTGSQFYQSNANGVFQCGTPAGGGGSTSGTILSATVNQIALYQTNPTGTTLYGTSSYTFTPGTNTSTLIMGVSSTASSAGKPACIQALDTVNSSTYNIIQWISGVPYFTSSSTCQ